jgi:hypothetical protein
MRLLLTADFHLNDNPRDAYRFTAAEQVRRIAIEQAVDHLFILGDLTDHGEGHTAAFTNRVVETLALIATSCPVSVIYGTASHDGDPRTPFFRFINAIPDCRYVTTTEFWECDGWRAALIPNGQWPAVLPEADAIFTHHTFAGARAENDQTLGGVRMPMGSVPIYSGDVHVPQRHGPVIYVGPPTLIRFGDSYQPRVILLDTKLMGDKRVYATIPVKGPKKRLLNVTAHPDGKLVWEKATVGAGDVVKVRVHFSGKVPPLAGVAATIRAATDKAGIVLYAIEPQVAGHTTEMPKVPVARSDRDLVIQYGEAQGLDHPTIEAGLSVVARR